MVWRSSPPIRFSIGNLMCVVAFAAVGISAILVLERAVADHEPFVRGDAVRLTASPRESLRLPPLKLGTWDDKPLRACQP